MGKVWGFDSLGQLQYTCSGTLVTVNIVLTAGHCLWDNENELIAGGGYIGSQYTILFTPGSAYAGDNGDQVASTTAPYGVYQAQYWGVPNCYVASTAWPQGNGHCDIGLMQVSPSGGHNPGEYTGTYPVVYGLTAYPNQTEFENAGYPASGTFFSSATGGYGDAPYYCDNIWDGRRLSNTDADTSNDEPLVGDGLDLTKSCGATGGASGGPVFTPYNGAWYIDGVNNIGDDPKFHPESNGFSYTNGHQIFDTAVSGPFLCNYICAGTASTASMRTATAASRPRLGRPPRFGAQAFAGIARSMGARGDGAPRDARPLYPHARPTSMARPQR